MPVAGIAKARSASSLLEDIALETGAWTCTLALDPDDPYFFDHPLDHVPAMALVSGLLTLVRSAGVGHLEQPGYRLEMSLALPSFCELGSAVRLEVAELGPAGAVGPADAVGAVGPAGAGPGQDARVTVRARQAGRVVCEGDLIFRAAASSASPPPGPACSSRPAERSLVHRRHAENVLISGMVTDGGGCTVRVRRPPDGHLLATGAGQALPAEVLIDAARQFGTLICHAELGAPPDTQFILLRIGMDVPCGLERGVRLRWRRTAPPGRRATMDLEVTGDGPDGEPCGRIALDYFGATHAAYRRLRGR
jgi:hypothetical protein